VVGHPVVALPCGLDEQATPFGLQVIGPMYADRALLSAAQALEQAFSGSPNLARPIPDFEVLAHTDSTCRTVGKTVG
jgi:amidase